MNIEAFNAIPAELRLRRAWVLWKPIERGGRTTKIPIDAHTGRSASTTNSQTWTTFDEALASRNGHPGGIGYVFSEGDPYCGIDLDSCRNPDTGELTPEAATIVQRLSSYTEISPSGRGLHIIVRAELRGTRRRKGHFETYDNARFFCCTGNRLPGTPLTVEPRQIELDAICAEQFGPAEPADAPAATAKSTPPVAPAAPAATVASALTDGDILELARSAKNGEAFTRLWVGDVSGYPSQSEADLALCSHLAFYCGGDEGRVDLLFRKSGLMRPKWDEVHFGDGGLYGAVTVKTAVAGLTAKYDPNYVGRPLTELWLAERLVARHGRDLHHNSGFGWLVWDGSRWCRDDCGELGRRCKETVVSLYAEAAHLDDDARKGLVNFARKSENSRTFTGIETLAKSEPGVAVRTEALNRDPWLFNVANGTIDLRTGTLREHRRKDLITKLSPVTFDPTAQCPRFLLFLDCIFGGDEDLIEFVQRATGSALVGVVRDHNLHLLYGTGRNGKTTLIETLASVFGDYSKSAAPGLLLRKPYEQHPTELAELFGVRFLSSMESGEGKRLDEEKVKRLTGGDTISGRFMHHDFFDFSPSHHVFFGTNHRPEIHGTDLAVWARVKLWPFNWTCPPERCDPELGEKLRIEESAGILRWLVDGCIRWQVDGLQEPAAVRAASGEYRDESDVVGRFIAECCTTGRSQLAATAEAYRVFEGWTESAMSKRAFGDRLRERGFRTVRGVWAPV